jgi:hypothetical protein
MASSIFIFAGGFSTNGAGAFGWPLGTTLTEVSQSILTLGPAGTSLPILNFGGSTSATPSLRRNGTTLETILSDASAYTTHAALTFNAQSTGAFFWATRSILSSPANAQMNLTNNGSSAGVGFDVTTDGLLLLRTRAQTGYATFDALGYKVSGVAGVATFGPAAVASITVAGGIITAIS